MSVVWYRCDAEGVPYLLGKVGIEKAGERGSKEGSFCGGGLGVAEPLYSMSGNSMLIGFEQRCFWRT